MSNESGEPFTLEASADLSASQYCGMTTDANGRLALPAAGTHIIGILYTKPKALGQAGTVRRGLGKQKAKIGTGGCTAGGLLKIAADGTFVAAASTNLAVAKALTTNAAGDIGTVLLLTMVAP